MIYAMLFEKFFPGELAFFLLACWATWVTGRATAITWRPLTTLFVYMLGLAAGVRFLHYALYEGPFLSVIHYTSDLFALCIVGFVAYRFTRTNQMVSQYGWLYEKASPLSWRNRG
jgi:hypothetical protein